MTPPKIHLFNPENDLALAADLVNFTAPKGAVAIRNAGTYLPMFWTEKDDLILANTEIDSAMNHYRQRYNLHGTASSIVPNGYHPSPWGWSRYTRNEFIKAGACEASLPDSRTIEQIRMLSHRRTAIAINRAIGVSENIMTVEAFSIEQAREAVARMGDSVIKLPWSSSGRGVLYSSHINPKNFDIYIGGMIANQGSVTIEKELNKLQDFATLFYSNGESVEYRGLSIFATSNAGFYEGNIVEPQHLLTKRLGVNINDIIAELERILTIIVAPLYKGWLGIDMMLFTNNQGSIEIAPCIEMNLRMTLGVAAMAAATKVFPIEQKPMLLKVSHLGVSLNPM